MAKKDHRSRRALAAAERLFKRRPGATTDEFRKVCERADKAAIRKLSNREFNASYVLPLRRSKTLKRRSGKPATHLQRIEEAIVQMVRQRDAEVLAAADDPQQVYEIAAAARDFARQLARAATQKSS